MWPLSAVDLVASWCCGRKEGLRAQQLPGWSSTSTAARLIPKRTSMSLTAPGWSRNGLWARQLQGWSRKERLWAWQHQADPEMVYELDSCKADPEKNIYELDSTRLIQKWSMSSTAARLIPKRTSMSLTAPGWSRNGLWARQLWGWSRNGLWARQLQGWSRKEYATRLIQKSKSLLPSNPIRSHREYF